MTNFEKYKDEILAFVHKNVSTPAVVNGEFAKCSVTDCGKTLLVDAVTSMTIVRTALMFTGSRRWNDVSGFREDNGTKQRIQI